MMQILRKNRAKILQNFRKSGTPRAQKLRAVGQRALRILYNVAESLPSQHCIQIRKSKRPALGSRKFFAQLERKDCKVSEKFRPPRAQKLREVGQRGCANLRTSLQLFSDSVCVLMQDNGRVQHRGHANVAQKSREKFAKFRKSGTYRAQKMRAFGQRALRMLQNVAVR